MAGCRHKVADGTRGTKSNLDVKNSVWCYLAATSAFDSPFTFPNPTTVLQNPGVAKNERFLWFFWLHATNATKRL
jgi:hypothetical protein